MYTNLVILTMWLEGRPLLAQLSTGRDRSVTQEGKEEADLLLWKTIFKNKQPAPLWIMVAAAKISKSAPNNNRKKEILNGFNSPGITLADPWTGVCGREQLWTATVLRFLDHQGSLILLTVIFKVNSVGEH